MGARHVAVVPSTSIPVGLAAMVAFDPEATRCGERARAWARPSSDVHSAEVTHAVRDSELDGVEVRKGQAIGIVDGGLAAAGDDLVDVFRACRALPVAKDAELVTVLTALNGSGGRRASELRGRAAEACPTREVSFHEGGQPLYPILASAE